MLVSQFGINILQSFFLFLLLFDTSKLILHFLVKIFKQTLFKSGDRIFKSIQFVVNSTLSGKNLSLFDIVFADSFFEQLFSSSNFIKGIVVLLGFNVASSFVIVVEWLIGVQFDGLFVEIDGLIKVFFLELLVALVLEVLCGVFNFHFFGFFLLFLLFALWRR